MKEKYGVQKYQVRNKTSGTQGYTYSDIDYVYYYIEWYDTLEEAIKNANGEPIIKSVAYEVKEQE